MSSPVVPGTGAKQDVEMGGEHMARDMDELSEPPSPLPSITRASAENFKGCWGNREIGFRGQMREGNKALPEGAVLLKLPGM